MAVKGMSPSAVVVFFDSIASVEVKSETEASRPYIMPENWTVERLYCVVRAGRRMDCEDHEVPVATRNMIMMGQMPYVWHNES
jgi:hypothetical protein